MKKGGRKSVPEKIETLLKSEAYKFVKKYDFFVISGQDESNNESVVLSKIMKFEEFKAEPGLNFFILSILYHSVIFIFGSLGDISNSSHNQSGLLNFYF